VKNKLKGILAVVLTFSLLSTLLFAGAIPASAAPGENEWDDIAMPVLVEDTEVGVMAVAPDGTIFAAMYDWGAQEWDIMRSDDGGFNWTATELTGIADDAVWYQSWSENDATVVDIAVSPNWPDDDTVYVACSNGDVYRLPDGGDGVPVLLFPIVDSMGEVVDGTSGRFLYDMDIWSDGTYNYLAVATDLDVFVMKDALLESWLDMELATESEYGYAVQVDFAPDFGTSNLLWAIASSVVNSHDELMLTSTISPGQWGNSVAEVKFENEDGDYNWWTPFVDIAFASDYTSELPVLYVAIAEDDFEDEGNLYLVQGELNEVTPGDTTADWLLLEDRDVGSVEVSGNVILTMDSFDGTVIVSYDGGNTFSEASRSPQGSFWGHVYMAPGTFEEGDGTAYANVIDYGFAGVSGVYRTTDGGDLWDGISYLDMSIDDIIDIAFSPVTASQPALMLVEYDGDTYIFYTADATAATPQWVMKDGEETFDLWDIDMIEWSLDGSTVMFMAWKAGDYTVWKSTDDANSFSFWRNVPDLVGDPADWVVVDGTTVYVIGSDGFWGTTAFGPATVSDEVDEGVSIDVFEDMIAVGMTGGGIAVTDDGGDTWDIDDVGDGDVFVAFGPDGALYAATSSSQVLEVDPTDTGDFEAVEDSNEDTAEATSFSGIWVSPDNTLYALGGDSATTTPGTLEANGTIDITGDSSAYTQDEVSIDGLPITVVSGTFSNGEDFTIVGDTLEVDAIFDNLISGRVYIQTVAGDNGYFDVSITVTPGNFTAGEECTPVEGAVNNEANIPQVPATGDAGYLFRLLIGEAGNVWETAAIDDAEGLWGTTGSNILWTIVDDAGDFSIWALEDFLSGPVTLLSPDDGSTVPGFYNATLTWEALDGGEAYEIGGTVTDGAVAIDDDDATAAVTGLDDNEEYTWMVRVEAGSPFQSRWSDSWTFTTTDFLDKPENKHHHRLP